MRILQTCEAFYPYMSGPANQAYWNAVGLYKRGHEAPMFTTYANVTPKEPAHEFYRGVEVFRYNYQFHFARYFFSLGMIGKFGKYDVVHAHNYRNFQADLSLLSAKWNRKPYVINPHGGLLGYTKINLNWRRRIPYHVYDFCTMRSAIMRANAVILCSPQEQEEAHAFGVPDKKCRIIPMGINADPQPTAQKDEGPLRLLFVGRIARDRNVEPIIKALKEVPNATLSVVGREERRSSMTKLGYIEDLKQLAQDCGVQDRVFFTGPKYDEELKKAFRDAQAFVYTSYYENFGHAILEAAAVGLPLICTEVGVALDLIKDGETGFLVQPDDVSTIVKRIRDLQDAKTRASFGAKVLAKVQKDYSWDTIIDQLLEIYKTV